MKLTSKGTWEAFVKKTGTHFTQLSRLPYFDLVHSIIINPMHNLILGEWLLNYNISLLHWSRPTCSLVAGLVKTHFYNIWIQCKILCSNHKLKVLHKILQQVMSPQLTPSALVKTSHSLNCLPTLDAYPPLSVNRVVAPSLPISG